MADDEPEGPSEQAPERPAPPPFCPDLDLIGYMERGQKPPERRSER